MPAPISSQSPKLPRTRTTILLLASIALGLTMSAQAQTDTTIYNFGTTAPSQPPSGPVFDKAGNLYGVATYGGTANSGVVYKLTPVSGGWEESVIYNFSGGTDGGHPYSSPILDRAGNLYGTASSGGNLTTQACNSYGCGVVYKLSPTSTGEWKESVLYAFTGGNDGSFPTLGNLVFDKAGNLYSSNMAGPTSRTARTPAAAA